MEKLIYKVKTGDWEYFTNTEDISGLKKYGVNSKNIDKLASIVNENMSGKINLSKEGDNLNSKYKIQDLRILRFSLRMLMLHNARIEAMMISLGLEFKPDPRIEDAIKEHTDNLEEITQLKVKTIEDLKKIDKEIKRREDKYDERNQKQVVDINTITFSESMEIVFSTLGEQIDYNIVLNHFFIKKDKAIKLNGKVK